MRYYIGLIIDWTNSFIFKIKRVLSIIVFYLKCAWYICFYHKKHVAPTGIKPLSYYKPDTGSLSENYSFINQQPTLDLSIIIPAYNCSNYIDRCLQSTLCQKSNYTYEIIVVDDGSTDNTYEIVNRIAQEENRIVLLKQINSGQSAARNNGIYYSSGRYIMFVDADDVLLPNSIEVLMKTAENTQSDIVEGSFVRFYNDITDEMIKDSKGKNRIESNDKNPRYVLTTYGYSWAKIYKRELWDSLRFPEGYIFEDVITKFILRRKANQVSYIQDVVYGYRQNNQSSSHGNNQLKKLDSIWVLPKVLELCEQEGVPRDDVFYLLALNHIGLLNYITTKSQSKEIKLSCFAEMHKQLLSIQDCKPKKMPLIFKLLDRAILENKYEAWEYIAETINKYKMLKKWREIN